MMETAQQKLIEHGKEVVDVGAAGITVAAIMDYAPAVAAVFTALYAIVRLIEFVDSWLYKRKQRKNADDS